MKYLLLIGCVFTLSGCGWFDRELAKLSGYSTVCVKGVEYIQFTSGATPMYRSDGTLVTC